MDLKERAIQAYNQKQKRDTKRQREINLRDAKRIARLLAQDIDIVNATPNDDGTVTAGPFTFREVRGIGIGSNWLEVHYNEWNTGDWAPVHNLAGVGKHLLNPPQRQKKAEKVPPFEERSIQILKHIESNIEIIANSIEAIADVLEYRD